MPQGQGRVINCCVYYVTLIRSLYLVFLRPQSAHNPQDMGKMLFLYFVFLYFLRSSSPLTGQPPLVFDFRLTQGQRTKSQVEKFYQEKKIKVFLMKS